MKTFFVIIGVAAVVCAITLTLIDFEPTATNPPVKDTQFSIDLTETGSVILVTDPARAAEFLSFFKNYEFIKEGDLWDTWKIETSSNWVFYIYVVKDPYYLRAVADMASAKETACVFKLGFY